MTTAQLQLLQVFGTRQLSMAIRLAAQASECGSDTGSSLDVDAAEDKQGNGSDFQGEETVEEDILSLFPSLNPCSAQVLLSLISVLKLCWSVHARFVSRQLF